MLYTNNSLSGEIRYLSENKLNIIYYTEDCNENKSRIKWIW